MNPSTSTRITAGVTATYLRDITRRPQPTARPDARRATHGRRPDRGLRRPPGIAGARRAR
jgi:hypothetical protein